MNKRIIATFLALSMTFSLTSCGAANTIETNEAPLVYPVTIESSLYDYATSAPNVLYKTPASENKLSGNAYFVTGKVTQIVNSKDSLSGGRYFVVENEHGNIYFLDLIDMICNIDITNEEKEVSFAMYGSDYDNTFPQVNEIVTVYGLYNGYSNVFEAPVFYFGLNENTQKLLFENSENNDTAETALKITDTESTAEISEYPNSVSENDFFSNIDKEEYYSNYHSGRYDLIYEDVLGYINEYTPIDTDNAYTLKEILDPVMEVWDDVAINYDSFEEQASFYCNGVQNISQTIHFVPYATTKDRNIFVSVGFMSDDWLFTDDIQIKTSDDYIRLYSPITETQDVLNGGMIQEMFSYSFDDDDIAEFNTSNSHVMRFSNDDSGRYLDFTMTKEEEHAFDVISRFWNVRNQLDDLAYNYYRRLEQQQ